MKAKKSLGQNFLKSEKAINSMVRVSDISGEDLILEIGPGMGVLTEALLKTGVKVVAIEKDNLLIPILLEKFEKEISSGQLKIIHQDILDYNIEKIEAKKYKLVANIPYYITGHIIRKFLESRNQPSSMTLLVQKEVAERIVAKDGKESLLSLSVKIYADPKYIETVKRGSFNPSPKVDSAIIFISNISKNNFQDKMLEVEEKKFFNLIRAGFAHKRKQLFPNLSAIYKKDTLESAFLDLKLDKKCRAEDLPIKTWIKLSESLN